MDKCVRELYEGDGAIGSKYLLTIYEDGTLKLTWYHMDTCIEEENPVLIPAGKGLRIQYGSNNCRSSIGFSKYSDGSLDKRWTKIK